MQYILIQVLLSSLFHLPIDSTTCLFCLALENKEENETNKLALQAETYTQKIHKNTKLETIIYKQRPLRQNCPLTGNNHTTLLPERMRL